MVPHTALPGRHQGTQMSNMGPSGAMHALFTVHGPSIHLYFPYSKKLSVKNRGPVAARPDS